MFVQKVKLIVTGRQETRSEVSDSDCVSGKNRGDRNPIPWQGGEDDDRKSQISL